METERGKQTTGAQQLSSIVDREALGWSRQLSLSILSIARLSTVTMHEQLCISAPGVPDILCHLQILASCNNIYSLTHFIRPILTICFSFELVPLESKRLRFFRISSVCLRDIYSSPSLCHHRYRLHLSDFVSFLCGLESRSMRSS